MIRNEAIVNEIVLAEFFAIITDSRRMQFPWSASKAKEYLTILLDSVRQVHFLNDLIISEALENIKKYDIKRYNIYDHLIAHSMKFYGTSKIVTLNEKDFKKYDFIEEIIKPRVN